MLFFPIGTDRPQRAFPWVNALLIAVNVALYVMSHVPIGESAGRMAVPTASGLLPGFDGWMLNPQPPGHLELYQFISYQFLHANLQHLFFNMLFLYVFGNNLNEKLGHLGYLAFYLAGGILAGCGQVFTSAAPTLGASGSISAVSGLFLLLLPRTHIRVFVWLFIYIDVWEIPSMLFILFNAGKDVLEQIFDSGGGVATMAHLSGTAAGAAIGLLLLLTHLVQRDHYDLLAMLNRYRRRKTYESLVAKGYEPFSRPAAASTGAKPGRVGETSVVDPRVESLRGEISRLIRLHTLEEAAERYLELRKISATGEAGGAAVLQEQEQLDVANQLMSGGKYAEAAGAYEDYLRVYTGGNQRDQVTLILGVIYARYLARHARSRELLQSVLPKLHNERERQMAQGELQWLDGHPDAPAPG